MNTAYSTVTGPWLVTCQEEGACLECPVQDPVNTNRIYDGTAGSTLNLVSLHFVRRADTQDSLKCGALSAGHDGYGGFLHFLLPLIYSTGTALAWTGLPQAATPAPPHPPHPPAMTMTTPCAGSGEAGASS